MMPPKSIYLREYFTLSMLIVRCIAISGLASHPFGSWTPRYDKRQRSKYRSYMWLRDSVPQIPGVRMVTYGYDSRLIGSHSVQTTEDIARAFVVKLRSVKSIVAEGKPLVFLAHSLGGIILKNAIVYLAGKELNSSQIKAIGVGDRERDILRLIRAMYFFGVPNKGMYMSHLLPMVQGRPNENFVKLLTKKSRYLTELDDAFGRIAKELHFQVFSIYETGLSHTVAVSLNHLQF
jgi:hypothetical protein